jgi:uncharacterized protein YlxW (UPF0749 family)
MNTPRNRSAKDAPRFRRDPKSVSAHPKSRKAGSGTPAKAAVRRSKPPVPVETPAEAPIEPPAPKRPTRVASVLIGVLLAALGFAIAVQIRSVSSSDALSGARPDELARILADLNDRQSRLQGQIAQLQGELRKLDTSGSNDTAARDAAQRKADALGVLTGTLPATGPGIVLTINDPKGKLTAEDLLDVVEELRGSGAEAMQFGPVRIGTSSAFVDTDDGVQLDGVGLRAPYRVLAIGPPSTMATALRIPDGVVATVEAAGGSARIDQRSAIEIKVLRMLPNTKYSTPTK